jgi:GGDEF domain-containing protein
MDQCGELIEKIRENMHKSMENAGLEPWERVSAAMGYAVFEEGDDVEAVFRRADSNMYADKKRMHELELST